jgi:hypothetical protein
VLAINNGKRMVLALNDFAAEYGSFPDRTTAKLIRQCQAGAHPRGQKGTVMGHRTLLETGEGTLWGEQIQPLIKPPLTPPQWKPGQAMPHHQPKQQWFWLVCLLGGGLALALIAAWAVWRKDGHLPTIFFLCHRPAFKSQRLVPLPACASS